MKLVQFFKKSKPSFTGTSLKLNLGCGKMYLKDWINIDIDSNIKSDLCCDLLHVKDHFDHGTVQEMMLLHSISYLRLWEATIFFKDAFNLLELNGKLVLEFPDVVKCAKIMAVTDDVNEYMECVRAIYAFDLEQIKNKDPFITYPFGWSAFHITKVLTEIGFKTVTVLPPLTHDKRDWRDTRIEAIK